MGRSRVGLLRMVIRTQKHEIGNSNSRRNMKERLGRMFSYALGYFRPWSLAVMVFALVLLPIGAQAHVGGEGGAGGFISGLLHPVLGADHVVAMVAVGLWGAILGLPAIWILPVTFPLVMAFGGVLGMAGVSIPAVEQGIALSAIVLGALVALARPVPLWLAGIIVGVFAIFHGHAHGTELPGSANAVTYAIGFVIATGLLHLVGIGFGTLARSAIGMKLVRAGGGVIALAGVYFLFA